MSLRIYRVAVRGRFANLSDEARSTLVAEAPQHDTVSVGAFTDDGTLTYERAVDFFTFRFQIRTRGDDARAEAELEAIDRAQRYLSQRGLGFRDVTVQATDMATIWD